MKIKELQKKLKNSWKDTVKATLYNKKILEEKYLIRQWYEEIYSFTKKNLKKGTVNVEIGSGSSFLYKHIKGLIKSNVVDIPGNDLTFDACKKFPFKKNSIDNLILISVFHHLPKPELFLKEATRTLKKGGRIIISDPYISFLSYPLWKYLHPEGCDLSQVGFNSESNPLLDANSGSATLMFYKNRNIIEKKFPSLKIKKVIPHTIFHYWIAGGYNLPQLLPDKGIGLIHILEKIFSPFKSFLASFLYVIIEKNAY
ncbi:MAG: class I SAM-dependent methyltransferase [Patescibacteria group bacterium]|nr:class I SAM-dependent methyltransferase [Patescibacteria group bacterium]